MADKLKIEVQDELGNIYYIQTTSDIVFFEDGKSVQDKIGSVKNIVKTKEELALVTEQNFLPDAKAVADLIGEVNSNLKDGFSPLTSSKNGIFKHPSGLMLQWGTYPSIAMPYDARCGGHTVTFNFRESFSDTPQVFTDCVYSMGSVLTSTLEATNERVTLFAKETANGLYVRWCAIGAWK